MKPDPNSLRITKALDRQDEFDSVMAWLGKMVSACNELELNFQRFLVYLLQCQKNESAVIVSLERRRIEDLVALVEKLFAVYVQKEDAIKELKAVGDCAKDLYKNAIHTFTRFGIRAKRPQPSGSKI